MDVLLFILSAFCLLAGFMGCILPALPGPPISYVGLLLLHFTDKVEFSKPLLLILLLLVLLTLVLDNLIPVLGSRYSGGTRWGSWGAFVGSVLGLFFLPVGLVAGPFFGALVGELLGNNDWKLGVKSGIGAVVGFLFGTVVKLALCSYFIVLFFESLF